MCLHFFLKKLHWGTPLFSISALPRYFSLACQAPRLCKQLLFFNSHQKHIFLIDVSIPCSAKPLQVLGSSKFPTIKMSGWVVSLDYLRSSQRQALNTASLPGIRSTSWVCSTACTSSLGRQRFYIKIKAMLTLTFNSNFSFNRLGFMVQRKHSTSDMYTS